MQKTSKPRYFTDMKRVRQKTDSYCGPAVLEMLTSFVGIDIKQNKLVKVSKMQEKINGYGMNIQDLSSAIKSMELEVDFWYKEDADLEDLDKLVNVYKYPVGVEWRGVFEEYSEEGDDDGHYSVLTSFSPLINKLTIADPYRRFANSDRVFDIDFFLTRWWDFNELPDPFTGKMKSIKDNHMIFIVTPRNENFPRELGMIKA